MKQIVITQNDFGIELQVQFLDSSKSPINLTGYFVEIDFVNPSGTLTTKQGQIIDNVNGICSYILLTNETDTPGLWKTYWKIFNDSSNYVTAQEEVYYYIKSKDGGIG